MLSFRFLIYVTTRISVSPFAFLCGPAFSYSFVHVLTESAVLVSLNVDPVLSTAYPFILPPWIVQTYPLAIRNHKSPPLNGFLTGRVSNKSFFAIGVIRETGCVPLADQTFIHPGGCRRSAR